MRTILIVSAAALILVLFVMFKGAQDAMERNSRRGDWAIFIVRWVIGSHWTGRPQTNAGFKRKGTKALTQTGFAAPFYFRPRWFRIIRRNVVTFGPFGIAYGVFTDLTATLTVITCLAIGAGVYGAYRAAQRLQRRTHTRDWIAPLHERIAPLADVPLSVPPSSWLEVSRDRMRAKLKLPASFNNSELSRERLALRSAEALGMEEPEIIWSLEGKNPELELLASPAPPKFVGLADVIGHIKNASQDTFILGLGKRSVPVDVSLHDDSPHIGASMGAGAGKSTLARFVAAQALYKGAIVLFLDTKRISHTWARGLPNVIYADTPELVHEALLWLGGEMERRNEVAVFSSDDEGEVGAFVGPRIIVIAEELNLTANRLRTYWQEVLGGKGISPALVALQDVAFAGRQVRMNIFMIGQMLTARVTGGTSGGGEARENVGVRMLARYTKRNWQMLVPEHPMPLVSDVLGRIQVIASGKVRETQVAYITGAEAKKLAMAGEVAALPHDLPPALKSSVPRARPGIEIARDTDVTKPMNLTPGQAEDAVNPEPDAESDTAIPRVTFPEVIEQKIFPGVTLHMLKNARRRDPNFPKSVGIRSLAHEYLLTDLADYVKAKKMGK